ncbi:MAG: hypothetical protein QXX38_00330 [Candidatus Aenigmatarchaeota archaeon]
MEHEIKEIRKFGEGLFLEDGSFVPYGKISLRYEKYCLGEYDVSSVAENLNLFLEEAKKLINSRRESYVFLSSQGCIPFYLVPLREELISLANKHFKK